MKVIAFLKAKDTKSSDELMVQISHQEFERIMGLEGRENMTNISRMQGKTLKLPDTFGELTWMKKHKTKLRASATDMTNMAKLIKALLPEED